MKQIFRCRFGSHLYGTSTPMSDVDYKSIFIPDGRDILLQRVKNVSNDYRQKLEFEKNLAGEEEEERFSLQRYLQLAAEGQTVAMDILFAPDWALTDEPTWHWHEIQMSRDKLLTRKSAAFIGYARQQANKYGIKGSRVAAARRALEFLERSLEAYGTTAKLGDVRLEIERWAIGVEHMAITTYTHGDGRTEELWEVCNRKMPFTASIGNAYDIMARVVDEYGKRALMAESQQGVDWKALSHAVRVGHQALELLSTGFVTFPLPNAAHVLSIKLGEKRYQDVATEIEGLLVKIEAAAAVSSLPDEPDQQWIDDFVASCHRDAVIA